MSCSGCEEKDKGLIDYGIKMYNNLSKEGKKIATAYKNIIIKNPEVEIVAKARMRICRKECGYHKFGICTKCGCPIEAKTRCMSCDCPAEEPLWKKYVKTIHL